MGNVDGLHRRSGLSASKLSELHGNSYIETCNCCDPPMEFVRPYDVYSTEDPNPKYWARYVQDTYGNRMIESNATLTRNEKSSGITHITGRACPKGGGPLRDSVIHFGESLPVDALDLAYAHSKRASVNLVLGCSMLVTPAASLPFEGSCPAALVSLSCTAKDKLALKRGGVLLRATADVVMEHLVRKLGVQFPNTPQLMDTLHKRVQARDRAVLQKDGDCPYDGGADGGVIPESMLVSLQPQAAGYGAGAAPSALETSLEQVPLQLRQSHALQNDGDHRWSLTLESSDGKLESLRNVQAVRFRIHPTFEPSEFVLKQPPFTIGPFTGWGTFDVAVDVEMIHSPTISASFPLSFASREKVMQLANMRP